jgi:GntR family transcriptional regulator
MSWLEVLKPVEHRDGIARYELVLEQLTQALFADPPPGNKLPPEPELADRLAVSRTTIRRAMAELEGRGVIARRQGLGTFFVAGNPTPGVPGLMSMDALRSAPGFRSHCLVFETVEVDERLAGFFEGQQGASLLHVKRADRIGQIPVAMTEVFVPSSLLPAVSREAVEKHSVHSLLERAGVVVSHAEQSVFADMWRAGDASAMGVEAGEAALIVERKTYALPDVPIDYAVMRFRQRTFRIQMELSRLPGSSSLKLSGQADELEDLLAGTGAAGGRVG